MGKRGKSQKEDMRNPKRRLRDGHESSVFSRKLAQLAVLKQNNANVISCADDLSKRKDIGEMRRKDELQVLAGAGIKSADNVIDSKDNDTEDSEDDFYNKVKQQRAAKLAAKAEMYSRTASTAALPETVDGKRSITYQMEKNRGLTRSRKKQLKNPRKKYQINYQKAVTRWKGQVRDIRKPIGPYGGETTGINVGISRSIRFKN